MTYLSKRTENQKNGEIILSTYADNKDNVQMSFRDKHVIPENKHVTRTREDDVVHVATTIAQIMLKFTKFFFSFHE